MNSEFGFDYLRDNTKVALAEQVQGPLDFAIVDEVDSILIDEARTPLIISGPAYGQTDRYRKADAVARELIERNRPWDRANRRVESLQAADQGPATASCPRPRGDQAEALAEQPRAGRGRAGRGRGASWPARRKHYEVELDKKSVHMTHEGVTARPGHRRRGQLLRRGATWSGRT